MKKRVICSGDNIYIDASYRRSIFDKWVWFKVGTKNEAHLLNKEIELGRRFDNVDLEFWSSKNRIDRNVC